MIEFFIGLFIGLSAGSLITFFTIAMLIKKKANEMMTQVKNELGDFKDIISKEEE